MTDSIEELTASRDRNWKLLLKATAAIKELIDDRDSWQAQADARTADAVRFAQERDAAIARAEATEADARDLRHLLDMRPAINAGLLQSYTEWTHKVYACEIHRALASQLQQEERG